jgi:hypothetical protein
MNTTFKALTSIALLASTAQFAEAHSGFKTATLSSADTTATTWNAINITHGCGGDAAGTTKKDVIALSILFPVAANKADFAANVMASKGLASAFTAATLPSTATADEKAAATAAVTNAVKSAIDPAYDSSVDFDFGATPTPTITALTTGNLFPNTIPVAVSGKIVGFQSWLGKPYTGGSPILETVKDESGATISTTGSGIFAISSIKFKPTSCVKTLKIYATSANWCESGKKSFDSATRLDAWIEPTDTILASGQNTADIQDIAAPPKLIINRDLTKTPLPTAGCDTATYDTVIIQPSTGFINKYLPIKSAKWPAGTSGQLFWPTVK